MAYPVLCLALAFVGGILLAAFMALPVWAWACCVAAGLALSWLCYAGERSLAQVLGSLVLAVFFMGAGLFSHHDRAYHRNFLHLLRFSEYMDVEGILSRSPVQRPDRDHLYLRVEGAGFRKIRVPLRGNLRISVPRSPNFSLPKGLLTGDRVLVAARLLPFPGYRNSPGASLERPFQVQNIHRLAHTKSPALVKRISRGRAFSLTRAVSSLRRRFQKSIEKQFMSTVPGGIAQEGSVLEALILGERSRLEDATIRDFQASGLFHLLAISGAHIAILTLLLYALVQRIPLPETLRCLLLLLSLGFFSLLVEGRPSVVRACSMASLTLLGKTLWKDVNMYNTLSISALIMLWIRPASLFDLGFQLTYAATLSILLFHSRIRRVLPRLSCRLDDILAVTLAAQMGVLPFSVRVFNRVTLAPLLLNAAALPLVAGIMIGGYAFVSVAGVLPCLAGAVAFPLRFLLQILLGLARVGARIPLLTCRVPTPSWLLCAAYILFLLAWLLPRFFRGQAAVAAAGYALSLWLVIFPPIPAARGELSVSFIDVGHGDAILVELPGRERILVDGGGQQEGTFDIGERVVSPFLWSRGIRRLDTLVLTHPHPDHGRGLQAVARNFNVTVLWEGAAHPTAVSSPWLHAELPHDLTRRPLSRGDTLTRAGVRIEVLHPGGTDSKSAPDPNRDSLVLRLVYGGTALLLTGDILAASEREILEEGEGISAEVLKSPHHGSKTSSSRAFLEAVSPGIVVISCGRQRQGLPAVEILGLYLRTGAMIYRTDIHGAIRVTTDGTNVSVRTVVPIPPIRIGYSP